MHRLYTKKLLLLIGVCFTCALLCCMARETACKVPEKPSDSLTIIDTDGSRISLSIEDLNKMTQVEEKECICVGEVVDFIGVFDYRGVRVADLLKKAPAGTSLSLYQQKSLYMVFKGTDGYGVIASWIELTQTACGRRTLIALEKDGKPLPSGEGKLRVVFPGDKYAGRSVKCLETIEIRLAPGLVDNQG